MLLLSGHKTSEILLSSMIAFLLINNNHILQILSLSNQTAAAINQSSSTTTVNNNDTNLKNNNNNSSNSIYNDIIDAGGIAGLHVDKPKVVVAEEPPPSPAPPPTDSDIEDIIDSLSNYSAWKEKVDSELRGSHINVTAWIETPYVNHINLSREIDLTKSIGPGIIMEILKDIQDVYNISYTISNDTTGIWGSRTCNGCDDWDGMIGEIQKGRFEMAAAAAILRHDRYEVVDFSAPFADSLTGILIRSPDRFIDHTWLIVAKPFAGTVWAVIAMSVFVSGMALKACCQALSVASEVQYSMLGSIWVFFSVFVQQGLPVQPKSWACRTMLAFWWLGALTLVATFTGNMVALFAVDKTMLPFSSPETFLQKLKQNKYTVIMQNTTDTRRKFLESSQTELYREMWKEIEKAGRLKNVSVLKEGVEMVKENPNHVLLAAKETLDMLAMNDCYVTVVPTGIIPTYFALIFRKGSDYRKLFSDRITQLVEKGFIVKWQKDSRNAVSLSMNQSKFDSNLTEAKQKRCEFSESVQAKGKPIRLNEAQGAFWVLIAGLCIAFTFLFSEHILGALKWTMTKVGIIKKPKQPPSPISTPNRRPTQFDIDATENITNGKDMVVEDINGFVKQRRNVLQFTGHTTAA